MVTMTSYRWPLPALVVSDMHLGAGDDKDDFHNDELFAQLLYKAKCDWGIKTVVVNGDGVEMLQVRNVSRVYAAHPLACNAIRSFVDVWVLGNHDRNLRRFCGMRAVTDVLFEDGTIAFHAHLLDFFNGGHGAWIGNAATKFAGWCERRIHHDADVWLGKLGARITGGGRHSENAGYAPKLREMMRRDKYIKRIVIGHTHEHQPFRDRIGNSGHWTGSNQDYLIVP